MAGWGLVGFFFIVRFQFYKLPVLVMLSLTLWVKFEFPEVSQFW